MGGVLWFAAVLVNVSLMRSWRKIIPELKGITAYGSSKANISFFHANRLLLCSLCGSGQDLRISQAEMILQRQFPTSLWLE
jgi:hypothetical protein